LFSPEKSTEPIGVSQHAIARCIEELESQGYAILEGVLDHAFCDEIIAEIQVLEGVDPDPV
jgi:hypothetical protein